MDYNGFLESKRHTSNNFGFEPIYMPDYLFDFQKYTVEKMMLKGRMAGFLDTGLGKTAIELTLAENGIRKTNRNVLIVTPLAVAFQFLDEAEKIGVGDICYSKDGKFKTKIVITNYERLHYFNPDDFDMVLLDESSILKNFDGAIKAQVTAFLKKIKYRYLSTATPSPNDFIELGTSSEALGYLGYTDMLGMFFTNNEDTIKPQNIGTKWILKGHAEDNFFQWVSSWSMSIRKPSDIGFSDERYQLPEKIENHHLIRNKTPLTINGQTQLFTSPARTLTEVREEQRVTINQRCEKAVEISSGHDTSVYWCNLNAEGDLLNEIDKEAYQIKGSMNIDKKEEILIAFAKGDIKKLITKAKMTAFGLNWQHCNHSTVFPTFSFEQYYQLMRRFWRFGQKRPVTIDSVLTDGLTRLLDAIRAKAKKSDQLFTRLNEHLNGHYEISKKEFNQEIEKPKFVA